MGRTNRRKNQPESEAIVKVEHVIDKQSVEEEEYRRDIEYITAADDRLGSDRQEPYGESFDEEEEEPIVSDTIGDFIRNEDDEDATSSSHKRFFPQQSLVSTDSYFSAVNEEQFWTRSSTQIEPFLSAVDLEEETDCEPTFDTTVDEMLLYDMFGENYDEKVDAMGFEEKVVLQKTLAERKKGQSEEEVRSRICKTLQLPKSPQASPVVKMAVPLPREIPLTSEPTMMKPPTQPSRSRLPQPRRKPVVAASPVAAYLRNNPQPSLVHNVPAKQVSSLKWRRATLLDVENPGSDVCFLPTNTYERAAAQEEIREEQEQEREYHYIPRAYGKQTAEVCVTKHLGRRERDDLDVSVLETRVVRKFGTPLQKDAN